MKKFPATAKLAALALIVAPFTASASGLDYTYVQGGYTASDWTDGVAFDGSFALNRDFQIVANYSHESIDDDFGGGSMNHWGIGAGYRHALTRNWDLGAQASYQKFDAHGYTDDGLDVKVGVRGNLIDKLDVNAYVGDGVTPYVHRGNFGHDTYFQVGAEYNFTRNWAISANYTARGHDYNPFFVGARYSF